VGKTIITPLLVTSHNSVAFTADQVSIFNFIFIHRFSNDVSRDVISAHLCAFFYIGERSVVVGLGSLMPPIYRVSDRGAKRGGRGRVVTMLIIF